MYKIAQEKAGNYINYMNYVLNLVGTGADITAQCTYAPIGRVVENIRIAFRKGEQLLQFEDFKTIKSEHTRYILNPDATVLTIYLSEGRQELENATIVFKAKRDGISIAAETGESGFVAEIIGEFSFGKEDSVSAVCMERLGKDMRTSYGPATTKIDDALFCRESDSAIRLSSEKSFRIQYDFCKNKYYFTAKQELKIGVEEHVLASRFHVKYRPINKNHTFPTPPAGWMTWYAVKFDACEQAVLENAAKQKELFADYGANTVWVDWEWCHSALNDEHPSPEIDFFHPDAKRYPHGLGYVADKIKEQGFIPALWVGPTVENILNDFAKENENSVYANWQSWCSQYFYNITSEAYIKEFIPKAFRKVVEDGYEAVKWDCLPVTLLTADEFHSHFADPSITTEQALKNVIQAGRDTLGKDFYMMSCSGEWDRSLLFAADVFDGARIGGDIFTWDEFIQNFLDRIMRFYAFHNNMFYCDPDNLVIRPEHNSYEQAISRTSIFSLLGLPITLGDDLRELPEDRIELIRRALPPLDIRPMDIRETNFDGTKVIANLRVSKPFEEWNVVSITNLLEEATSLTIDFDKELHLEEGEYLVYDYWNHKFIGIVSKEILLELPAYGSVVYSIRKYTGKKQIISTSRHISQGAYDLVDVCLGEDGVLRGRSNVVKNEPYIITYYEPNEKKVLEKVICTEETGEVEWNI